MLATSQESKVPACPDSQRRKDEDTAPETAPAPPPAKKPRLGPLLCFFSKSKAYPSGSELGRLLQPLGPRGLSNFAVLEHGYVRFGPDSAGAPLAFRSVEHAFQAAKYLFCHDAATFASFARPPWSELAGAQIKSLGGRRAFKQRGLRLDSARWAQVCAGVMLLLLVSRWEEDDWFAHVLRTCHERGYVCLHFERSGRRSFWGGHAAAGAGSYVGQNVLGRLLGWLARHGPEHVRAQQQEWCQAGMGVFEQAALWQQRFLADCPPLLV